MNVDLSTLLITVLLAVMAGWLLGRLRRGTRSSPVHQTVALQPLIYDALTGLYSPDLAVEILTRQFHLADRLQNALTVLVIEVDGQESRPVSDQVLQGVAQLLSRRVRKVDFLCRWQQARFLIISPVADVGSALVLAQDLVEVVAAANLAGSPGPGSVTVSVGVHSRRASPAPELSKSAIELIDAAMHALRISSAQGAGRIEIEP